MLIGFFWRDRVRWNRGFGWGDESRKVKFDLIRIRNGFDLSDSGVIQIDFGRIKMIDSNQMNQCWCWFMTKWIMDELWGSSFCLAIRIDDSFICHDLTFFSSESMWIIPNQFESFRINVNQTLIIYSYPFIRITYQSLFGTVCPCASSWDEFLVDLDFFLYLIRFFTKINQKNKSNEI